MRHLIDYKGDFFPCKGNDCNEFTSKIYGRLFREEIVTPDGVAPSRSKEIMILKYNVAFPASGLPKKIGFLREPI